MRQWRSGRPHRGRPTCDIAAALADNAAGGGVADQELRHDLLVGGGLSLNSVLSSGLGRSRGVHLRISSLAIGRSLPVLLQLGLCQSIGHLRAVL